MQLLTAPEMPWSSRLMTHRNMPTQTIRTAPIGVANASVAVAITTGTGTTRLRVRTGVSS